MLNLLEATLFSFGALFPVLNPLGAAVIFLTLTAGAPQEELNKIALKVGINTFVLLTVILLSGWWILKFFGISIPIVQVAGGLVVAFIGWTLLNQSNSATNNTPRGEKSVDEMAFFPLTMPITAGPGCIAVTLTIGAHELNHKWAVTLLGEIGATIGILLGALTVFFCFRYANRVINRLGTSGTQVIMRLFAFINLCIGVQIVWHGVQGLISTLPLS